MLGLVAILACSRDTTGELHVVVHSTTSDSAVEVLALPFDPARIRTSVAVSANGAPASPIPAAVAVVRDSALEFDSIFQRSRAVLNDEALALQKESRVSASYARAFDHWSRRAQEAEKIRATRDRLRRKLSALAPGTDTAAPSLSRFPMHDRLPLAQVMAAARRNGGIMERSTVKGGAATLKLPAGVWWIALVFADATALIRPQGISIEAAVRDTVSIPNR